MTTHVFIVDESTFKFHLEYMFAGTGASARQNSGGKDLLPSFDNQSSLSPAEEKLLVGMLADCSRVRKDDYVVFYLQSKQRREGRFYGIFKIAEAPFLDLGGKKEQYLSDKGLNKNLPFRVKICPYKVYSEGVTEWDALDDISQITSPSNMIWSLIYRKLRGNRGNTMITMFEAKRLLHLIKEKNLGNPINSKSFSFDVESQKIIPGNLYKYEGLQQDINILPRLIERIQEKKSHEAHLQAYLMGNLEKNPNLLSLLNIQAKSIKWIGNEVYCGVGMQKIDIAISVKIAEQEELLYIIELKDDYSSTDNFTQINKYIRWVTQYYCGNTPCFIQPVLISRKPLRRPPKKIAEIKKAKNIFNKGLPLNCHKIKTIEYEVQGNNLVFE